MAKPIATDQQIDTFMDFCSGPTLDLLEDMREKQRLRSYKGPWLERGVDIAGALKRLAEEFKELSDEVHELLLCGPQDEVLARKLLEGIRYETADVANFCVILNWFARQQQKEKLGHIPRESTESLKNRKKAKP